MEPPLVAKHTVAYAGGVSSARTIHDLIGDARAAYATLQELGEAIEDEWSYIQDLAAAWLGRLDEVAAARGVEPAPPGTGEAIDRVIAEVALITDHHRAIDWLSTYPQVVLVALGEGL